MTFTKRAPRAGEAFKDRVKQSASVVTRSRYTCAAGHRDQAVGHVTRVWVTIKGPFGK